METWASLIKEAQFICVCVESEGVAKMFDQMFGFEHALNGYIPGRHYMPHGYGQLGCSGFIISDSEGNFVTKKSSSYLDYGERAFREVETIISGLVDRQTTNTASPTDSAVQSKKAKDISMTDYVPPVIGIASMDEEHESCAIALKQLLTKPTQRNLAAALKELEKHFAHEEALMVQHGFGGSPEDPFSALTSHVKDHKRILAIGHQELEKSDRTQSSCSNGDIS